jgi:hypothetical protein
MVFNAGVVDGTREVAGSGGGVEGLHRRSSWISLEESLTSLVGSSISREESSTAHEESPTATVRSNDCDAGGVDYPGEVGYRHR